MPLKKKLEQNACKSKGKNPCCPYCSFFKSWKHGKYARKGFHRGADQPSDLILWVFRYLCRSPDCGRTFGVLPENVIPYQRFFWSDFLKVESESLSGKSCWGIFKSLSIKASLAVIVRTLRRIKQVREWAARLCRELEKPVTTTLASMGKYLAETLGWAVFTRRFFHALYPRRLVPDVNPHDSALQP